MVALVVLVVSLAVEQLHDDVDPLLLRQFHQPFQPAGAVLHALLVVEPPAIAGEADDVGDSGGGRLRDDGLVAGDELVVVLDAIEALADAHAGPVAHGAGQAVLPRRRPLDRAEQVDRADADGLGGLAKIVQGYFAVAPAADGVVDLPFQRLGRRRFLGGGGFRRQGHGGSGGGGRPPAKLHNAKRREMGVFIAKCLRWFECFRKRGIRINVSPRRADSRSRVGRQRGGTADERG